MLRFAAASAVEIWPTMFGTFSFAIDRRVAPAVRGRTASGKFTELRMLPFSRKSRSVSATIMAQFSSASPVDAPRCGSATTFGVILQLRSREVADVGVELAAVERFQHRRLVDDAAAREVQHDAAVAHQAQARGVDEAARARRATARAR